MLASGNIGWGAGGLGGGGSGLMSSHLIGHIGRFVYGGKNKAKMTAIFDESGQVLLCKRFALQ